MKAAVGEIRTHDAEGRLQSAGYEWIEGSIKPFFLGLSTILFAVIGVGAILLAMKAYAMEGIVILTGICIVSCALAWLSHRKWSGLDTRQIVVFHADGKIGLPNGLYNNRRARAFKQPWTEIASIAAEGHGVSLYFKDGAINGVAGAPRGVSAHKISVQLQLALTAIREAVAEASKPRRAPAPETQIVID